MPQAALANCVTDAQGVTTCSGNITTPQTIDNGTGEEDVEVTSGSSIVVSTDDQTPLRVRAFDSTVVNNGSIRFTGDNNSTDRPGNSAVLLETGVIPAGANTSNSLVNFTNNGSIVTTSTTFLGTGGVIAINSVGDVEVVNSSTGTISVTNFGINAEVLSAGDTASVTNNGTITAAGRGVLVTAHDGANAIAINTGTISSLAADGIDAFLDNDGTATIDNSGDITANGAFSAGILGNANGYSNSFDIDNSGSISVAGSGSTGIAVYALQGNVADIENTADGVIEVTGAGASGIFIDYFNSGTTTSQSLVNVSNAGEITTFGIDTVAINIDVDDGDVNVISSTTGVIDSEGAGILVRSTDGTASVVNAGTIDAAGAAISLRSFISGGVLNGENSGTIASGFSGVSAIVGSNGTATLNNSGDISVNTGGLSSSSMGSLSTLTLENSGNIDVTAQFGAAMEASSLANLATASLTNSGTLTFTGADSWGMAGFFAIDNDVSITNETDGEINIDGDDGVGIYADIFTSSGITAGEVVTLTNNGTIQEGNVTGSIGISFTTAGTGGSIANGANAVIDTETGIFAYSELGDIDVTNTGSITASSLALDLETLSTFGMYVTNSGTITGDIAAVGSGSGLFRLENSGTITGDVITSGTGDVVLHSGSLFGDVNLADGFDEMQISGSGTVIDGDLNGGADFDQLVFDGTVGLVFEQSILNFEQVTVSNGNIEISDATIAGASNFNVDTAGLLIVSGTSNNAEVGTFSNNGAVEVAAGSVLALTGDFAAADGSITTFVYDNGAGQLLADGDISFASDSQISVDVVDQDQLMDGTTFDVAIAGGTLSDASGDVSDNSFLFDFTKDVLNGNTLQLTIEQTLLLGDAAAQNGSGANSTAIAGALQSLIDSGSPDAAAVATALGQFPDLAGLAAAIDTFQLDSSAGLQLAQVELANDLMNMASMRQFGLRQGSGLWLIGGAGWGELDAGEGVDGFDSGRSILALGYDHQLGDDSTLVGAAFAYGQVEGEAVGGARLFEAESDGLSAMLYANGQSDQLGWHVSIGYTSFGTDTSRDVPVLSDIATSQFDGSGWFGELAFDYNLSGDASWKIAPLAKVRFAAVSNDGFAETGSIVGAIGQFEDLTSARGFVGFRAFSSSSEGENAGWTFMAEATYSHELGDTASGYQASLTGGPGFDVTTNGRDRSSFNLDTQIALEAGEAFELVAGYSGQFSGNYQDHAATLGAQVRF